MSSASPPPPEASEKLHAPADFDGPTKNRHCTDVLCLLLLIVSWVALTGIGIYAVQNGDIRLVLHPLDYDGNICGTDFQADMTEYPYLLFVNSYTGGVCVKECPDFSELNLTETTTDSSSSATANENNATMTESNDTQKSIHADVRTLITYNGIFQVDNAIIQDPNNFVQVADYSNSSSAISCTEAACYPDPSDPESSWTSAGVNQGFGFAYYVGSTYEILNYCYLTTEAEAAIAQQVGADKEETNNNNTDASSSSSATDIATDLAGIPSLQSTVDDLYSFWNKLYADLYLSRAYVFGFGFGLSFAISLVYIFLMRLPFLLTGIIWTSILATIALFFLGGYYAWNQASIWAEEEPQTVDDQTINLTTGFSIAMFVVGAILVLLACCLRKAIMQAILCTKEAGKAINSMIFILLVPVVQSIGFIFFLLPFVYYAANLASLGEITTVSVPLDVEIEGLTDQAPEISFRVFEFDDFTTRCGWYLLFSLFWTANWIVAMGDLIIATSVAKWYFTKQKWKIGSWTVLGSILDVTWYHAGTAAFGSLLVAIVQLIRAIIAKMQRTAKKADNKLGQCILCCCQCCFWCLECCLKFVNKNAYIQTAIFSTSFCKSCRESFGLIFRNAARVAAISYVSAAVLIVGKLFISSVVTVCAYYAIQESELAAQLHSVAGPVVVIFLLSYWLSDFFMDVLDMGIMTVLHCFVADEEMFRSGERYSEKSLKDFVDKHGAVKE